MTPDPDPTARDNDAMAAPQARPDAPGRRSDAAEQRRMRGATMVFAVATIFSRVAGMIRQIVVASLFGATTQLSAFTVASQIPNLIRALVADAALSAAFVPVFSELREKGEQERAWRIAGTFVGIILVALGPLVVLSMVLAPQLVSLFVDEEAFGAANLQLAVDLTRILMPIVVIMALSGLVVGILNAYDHFSTPALAPVAWNAVILLALVAIAPAVSEGTRMYVYAGGVLVGTVVQFLLPVPWLRRAATTAGDDRVRLRPRLALRDPRVREILLLMFPVTLSLGLINLQQLVDSAFSTHVPASLVPAGVEVGAGPAILENAFRIYMLPQGVFSVAISTVFFPALARLAARRDTERFTATFADGLRQIFLLLVPSAAFLAVLAEPVVRLLYQHGDFTAPQTEAVSDALRVLSVGLVFNGASLLLIRCFFSLKQTWLPTFVSALTLAVNAGVNLYVYDRYGVTGIAGTTSVVNVVGFLVMYLLLQRHAGRLGTRRTLTHLLGVVAASVVASGGAWGAWNLVDDALGRGIGGQLAAMLAAVGAAGVLYLVIILRLRLVERETLRALARMGKGRTGDAADDDAP